MIGRIGQQTTFQNQKMQQIRMNKSENKYKIEKQKDRNLFLTT